MAVLRDSGPYGNFNFLVDLGIGTDGPDAGFQEIQLPEASVSVIEYRNGSDRGCSVRKLPGNCKYGNIPLKRGYVGSRGLWEWYHQVCNGDAGRRRTVRIVLMDEAHTPVLAWKLTNCFPVKMTWSALNAKGNDAALECIELTCERLDLE